MHRTKTAVMLLVILFCFFMIWGCVQKAPVEKKQNIKRFGMVVGIDPAMIDKYKELHADTNPGVRDLLSKYHMQNFSIFLQEIDGKLYEFGYYEYTRDDYEGDMAKLDKEPRNIEWLKVCDPMQVPLPGAKGWTIMEKVYFNE